MSGLMLLDALAEARIDEAIAPTSIACDVK